MPEIALTTLAPLPSTPALEAGSELSTQEMFKTQVLKCEETVGGGCLGELCCQRL